MIDIEIIKVWIKDDNNIDKSICKVKPSNYIIEYQQIRNTSNIVVEFRVSEIDNNNFTVYW